MNTALGLLLWLMFATWVATFIDPFNTEMPGGGVYTRRTLRWTAGISAVVILFVMIRRNANTESMATPNSATSRAAMASSEARPSPRPIRVVQIERSYEKIQLGMTVEELKAVVHAVTEDEHTLFTLAGEHCLMIPGQCTDEQVFSANDNKFLFLSDRLARFNIRLSADKAQRLAGEFRSRYGSPSVDEENLGDGETIKTLSWGDGLTAVDVATLGPKLASVDIVDMEVQRVRAAQLERERNREQAEQAEVARLEANPPYKANILRTTWMFASVLDATAFFSADLDTQASMLSRGFGAEFERTQTGDSVTVEFFYNRSTGERGGKPTTDPSYVFITTTEGQEGYIPEDFVGPPIVSQAAAK